MESPQWWFQRRGNPASSVSDGTNMAAAVRGELCGDTRRQKQSDRTTNLTTDLLPFCPLCLFFGVFEFIFAQTQSLLSLSALCNHMSALLTFSKVFKKKKNNNKRQVRSQCQFFAVFFL